MGDEMTCGDRIKKARKIKGITQNELAIKLGVTQGMIGQYEKNKRNPKIETINKIANALGVSDSYLRGETDNPETQIINFKHEPGAKILEKIEGYSLTPQEALKLKADRMKDKTAETVGDYADFLIQRDGENNGAQTEPIEPL